MSEPLTDKDLLAALPRFSHPDGEPKHILAITVHWKHLACCTSGHDTDVELPIEAALEGFLEAVNATVDALKKENELLKQERGAALVYAQKLKDEYKMLWDGCERRLGELEGG